MIMKQLALVAALVMLPLAAHANPKDKAAAQSHIQKATQAHQAGNYEAALMELEAAYALDPQPDLLYAIGQVHVKLDNCQVAISFYERFLESNPGPEPSAAANEAISTCRAQLTAVTAEPEPQPLPEPLPPPPPPQPRAFDPIGSTLVGLGVVSTLVGIVMYSSAISTLDDADAAVTYMDHERLVDDARSKRTYAVVFGAAGVAAIGVGAWHYLRFRKAEQARVAITPTTSGGMITWMGRF
jgi:tetratricopeptide (TPR) repeat protein